MSYLFNKQQEHFRQQIRNKRNQLYFNSKRHIFPLDEQSSITQETPQIPDLSSTFPDLLSSFKKLNDYLINAKSPIHHEKVIQLYQKIDLTFIAQKGEDINKEILFFFCLFYRMTGIFKIAMKQTEKIAFWIKNSIYSQDSDMIVQVSLVIQWLFGLINWLENENSFIIDLGIYKILKDNQLFLINCQRADLFLYVLYLTLKSLKFDDFLPFMDLLKETITKNIEKEVELVYLILDQAILKSDEHQLMVITQMQQIYLSNIEFNNLYIYNVQKNIFWNLLRLLSHLIEKSQPNQIQYLINADILLIFSNLIQSEVIQLKHEILWNLSNILSQDYTIAQQVFDSTIWQQVLINMNAKNHQDLLEQLFFCLINGLNFMTDQQSFELICHQDIFRFFVYDTYSQSLASVQLLLLEKLFYLSENLGQPQAGFIKQYLLQRDPSSFLKKMEDLGFKENEEYIYRIFEDYLIQYV